MADTLKSQLEKLRREMNEEFNWKMQHQHYGGKPLTCCYRRPVSFELGKGGGTQDHGRSHRLYAEKHRFDFGED